VGWVALPQKLRTDARALGARPSCATAS